MNFELNSSEVLVVKGPNGVGKTTFLRLILGLHTPMSGGMSVNTDQISYLPQLQNLSFHLPVTLGDLVGIAPGTTREKIATLGLLDSEQLDLPWNTASGGERKRTLITRALLSDPKLVILDEPFNHLDRETKSAVTQTLIDYLRSTGGSVVMVSHEHDEKNFSDAGIALHHLNLGGG